MINFSFKKRSGFTITELLVGVSVFIVISTIMTGIFITAVKNQRVIQGVVAVNNNTAIVLEQMAREMRTGYQFDITDDNGNCGGIIGGGDKITFINGQNNSTTTFSLVINSGGNGIITHQVGNNTPEDLTASTVSVTRFCAYKIQENICDPERIVLVMEVSPQSMGEGVLPTRLQTTVSSRVLPREILGDVHNCRL